MAEPTALFLNHLDKEIQKFSLDPEDETLVRLWLLLAQLKRLGSGQILHEALDKCTDPQSPDFQDCVRRNVDFINEEAWSLKADAIQHAFVLPDVVVELEEAITVETDEVAFRWVIHADVERGAEAMRQLVCAQKERPAQEEQESSTAWNGIWNWEYGTLWHFCCIQNKVGKKGGLKQAFQKLGKMEASGERLVCPVGEAEGKETRKWSFKKSCDIGTQMHSFARDRLGLRSHTQIAPLHQQGGLWETLKTLDQELKKARSR